MKKLTIKQVSFLMFAFIIFAIFVLYFVFFLDGIIKIIPNFFEFSFVVLMQFNILLTLCFLAFFVIFNLLCVAFNKKTLYAQLKLKHKNLLFLILAIIMFINLGLSLWYMIDNLFSSTIPMLNNAEISNFPSLKKELEFMIPLNITFYFYIASLYCIGLTQYIFDYKNATCRLRHHQELGN